MEENFKTLEELYERLIPALKTKEKELHRHHMIYITQKDIWNFCYQTKWKSASELTLCDLVDDILNSDPYAIDEYLRRKKENILQS